MARLRDDLLAGRREAQAALGAFDKPCAEQALALGDASESVNRVTKQGAGAQAKC